MAVREITRDGIIVIDDEELTGVDVIEILKSRDTYLGWKRDGDKRIAELEALVASMHENGRRVTFNVETYINGIRFSTGDYQIMRIGPPADKNPPF